MTSFRTKSFRNQTSAVHAPRPDAELQDGGGGHGGGDLGLMRAFVRAVKAGKRETLGQGTGVEDVLRAHLVVFAAEKSRKDGTVVDVNEFEKCVRENM